MNTETGGQRFLCLTVCLFAKWNNKVHFARIWFHRLPATSEASPSVIQVCEQRKGHRTVKYFQRQHCRKLQSPCLLLVAVVPCSISGDLVELLCMLCVGCPLCSYAGIKWPRISPNSVLRIHFLSFIPWDPSLSDFPRWTIRPACQKEMKDNLPRSVFLWFS